MTEQEFILRISWADRIVIVLASAVFATVLSYFANYFHWVRGKKSEDKKNIASELGVLLTELENDISNYWVQDYSDDESTNLALLESRIKIRIRACTMLLESLFSDDPSSEAKKEFDQYLTALFEAATGGEFETTTRKSSKSIIREASMNIMKLKCGLLSFLKIGSRK